MTPGKRFRLFLGGSLGVGAALVGFAAWRVQGLPGNAPEHIVRDPGRPLVVCAGASVTRGTMSVNYIDLLESQLGDRFQFANAGRNGDLAFNLAQRLGPIIALRPEMVVLQIGTNDVNASLTPEAAENYRRLKNLPGLPSRDSYRENLRGIVRRLRLETRARLAILSLPLMGEDLGSVENERVRSYNEVVREVAAAEEATYLPLHEAMAEALTKSPSLHPVPPTSRLIGLSLAQRYLLGRSFDAIGAANGYQLLSDGLHLNRRGAAILADQIRRFVISDAQAPADRP